MSDEIFMTLVDLQTPREIWYRLKNTYNPTNLMNKMALKREFANIKMQNNENFNQFMNNLNEIVKKMIECGEKLSENEIIMKILESLPAKYDTIIQTISILFTKN